MAFRWMTSDSGHVVIQHGSGHGCAVVIEPSGEFKSDQVPEVVRLALDADWEPQQDGPNQYYIFDARNGFFSQRPT